MMNSPCLCPAMPVSQSQICELKLSLKTSKEASTIHPIAYSMGKELTIRVSTPASRSRSTPPVSRAQQNTKKTPPKTKTNGPTLAKRNGTLLRVSPTTGSATNSASSSSSSSSSTSTSKLAQTLPPQKLPSSSSFSSQNLKRTRWLSYSTSNICFNSILDGRFRQLQGRGLLYSHCHWYLLQAPCIFS